MYCTYPLQYLGQLSLLPSVVSASAFGISNSNNNKQCGRQVRPTRYAPARPPLTLTFHHLILNLVCQSHLRWGTFLPNLGTLGLWVLELFPMYATDGQDRRTNKSNAYCPLPMGGGIIINGNGGRRQKQHSNGASWLGLGSVVTWHHCAFLT